MSSSAAFFSPSPPASTGDASSPLFVPAGQRRANPLGSDISGVRALDYALTVASGRTALAQAILRRLTTPRGGLVGAPTYGYDVLGTIGAPVPASVVEHRVLEQVLYEEEVEDASCVVKFDAQSGTLGVLIHVVDADGPFDLTLTSDTLTVSAFLDGVALFEEAA